MINPKDIINERTVEELCITADNYFRSISDLIPQISKPFSNLIETPALLQNIGILLSELQLGKTMVVLDFGSGTCWLSKLLNQLQCQTISCDVSETALEMGKYLFKKFPIIGEYISDPIFLHFDGFKLDLPNKSVDRIICHDSFHHIPNQETILSEFVRVLKDGGMVGFSEPGRYHSKTAQSQYEMKNFDVLENDVDVKEIFSIAKKVGFTDIRCKLLHDMVMSIEDYLDIEKNVCDSNIKEGVFGNIRSEMTKRTIFFLYKNKFIPDSRSHLGLSHNIFIDKKKYMVGINNELILPLKIFNNGKTKWLVENINDIGVVKIGTHLYDDDDNLLDLDFSRHLFTNIVMPGEVIEKNITIKFDRPGIFKLCIDLVSEGICWFENVESKPQFVTMEVV